MTAPETSYFLGPKGQNAELWHELLDLIFQDYVHWRRNYHPNDPNIITRGDQHSVSAVRWIDDLSTHLQHVLDKLKADFPFYSPRYIAHMTSDQTLPSVLGFFAGTLYNPNNVSPEGAPVSVDFELEVGQWLAKMLGFPAGPSEPGRAQAWGHLTSGGTIANLEALWVARQAQFVPVMLADVCFNADTRSKITTALKDHGRELSKSVQRRLAHNAVWEHAGHSLHLLDIWHSLDGMAQPGMSGDDMQHVRVGQVLQRFTPQQQLSMPGELRDKLLRDTGSPGQAEKSYVTAYVLQALQDSIFSPGRQGYARAVAAISERLGASDGAGKSQPRRKLPKPVVFASETAHYSLAKACNILGYGSEALRLVPVDKHFRMDVAALRGMIDELKSHEYIAAIVAVAGTTEQGAVDPIHKLARLRKEAEELRNGSFWIHVDAAWGGYVAAVFDRDESDGSLVRDDPLSVLLHVHKKSLGDKGIERQVSIELPSPKEALTVTWGKGTDHKHVKKAFGAIRNADSVVIDPHKLGYTPYPAGAIVFQDRRTTLLTVQTVPYIGAGGGDDALGDPLAADRAVEVVGDYIVEGSKPGAAATSVWLAHKAIPLNAAGHGRIVEGTLLEAQKLARLLALNNSDIRVQQWLESNMDTQHLLIREFEHRKYHIGFQLVTKPDTNIVTFVARPMRCNKNGTGLEPIPWKIDELNGLNTRIHELLGKPAQLGRGVSNDEKRSVFPYGHPYFVSRTKMCSRQQCGGTYSRKSLQPLLHEVCGPYSPDFDRTADGLCALRCTMMSPYYVLARKAEKSCDFVLDFVRTLHLAGTDVLQQMTEGFSAYVLVEIDTSPGHTLPPAEIRRAEKIAKQIKHVRREKEWVRNSVPVTVAAPNGHAVITRANVLLEVEQKDDLPAAIREVGGFVQTLPEVTRTETFIRTEGRVGGHVAVDTPRAAYVFLRAGAGKARDICQKVERLRFSAGGADVSIVTGKYDIVIALAGMGVKHAKDLVRQIRDIRDVEGVDTYWVASSRSR